MNFGIPYGILKILVHPLVVKQGIKTLSMIIINDAYVFAEALPLKGSIYKRMESILIKDQMHYGQKRKMEYLAGRYCAQKALEYLGVNNFNISRQEDNSPLWPQGVVGSISHTKQLAVAAVSKKLKGIGIDAEALISTERFKNISKMIISSQEKILVKKDCNLYPTLAFSAKESLYKAIYPLCKEYFGFLDASLVDIQADRFKLLLHSENDQVAPFNGEYMGFYKIIDDTLISWITII